MRLTRITVYTPAVVLNYVASAYAAMLDSEPAVGEDERGAYVTVTDTAGFTIELRPVEPGEGAPTVTRLEFRGAAAAEAAERLHSVTDGVQRHLFGGQWDSIAGNSVRMISDGEDVSDEEKLRIRAAIQRGELEQELERMNAEP